MNTDSEQLNQITKEIIGLAYVVANKLGCGFFEKCYENALCYELTQAGFNVQAQVPLVVRYEEIVVGEYIADLVVEGSIVIELKAVEQLAPIHSAQCINYLAATGMPICLLINFGRRVTVKRFAGPSFKLDS